MDPDRWRKVESIFQEALDAGDSGRAGVLEQSCAGDESLRSEVESLLAQHEKGGSFIETPAFAAFLASGPASGSHNPIPDLAKTVIGHYRVLSRIGSGGMGVVYEAEDLKLRRHVALKFLPEDIAENFQSLERFRLEARAASALNHPNICTIYEVDEVEGRVFIAMELLEGQTLKQMISGKPLQVGTVVDLGIQIAAALDAAHSKGIVHRDIKPANVFVTKQRRIKVLDFGLAKLTQQPSDADEGGLTHRTDPGIVMGTVGYISPEQVSGQTADYHADIFAFGAVLYEMLTGKRPFEKATAAETMTAVLNEEPPAISQIAPNTPPALVRVVHRCLEKNPEQRFQSASDLGFALEALSTSFSVPPLAPGQPRRWQIVWTAVATGTVVALAALLFAWWRIPPPVPVVESVTQLTNDGEPKPGYIFLFSDGSRIYFTEGSPGSLRIAQVSVNGGPTSLIDTKLTNPEITGMAPDGSALLVVDYRSHNVPGNPLWSIPLPAGEPRRLGSLEVRGGTYLPDGLVFAKEKDLYVADKDGSIPRKLLSLDGETHPPHVSPDKQRVVFTLVANDIPSLVEVAVDGAGLRTIVSGHHVSCGVWNPDGKYLLYSAQSENSFDIWALAERTDLFHRPGQATRLTNGPLSYESVAPSPDGKHLFAVGTWNRGELVRYDMKSQQFVPFLSGISAVEPTFSQDGRWVAYASYPDGSLWRSGVDGSEAKQLTYPPMEVMLPRISPDGTRVAFTVPQRESYQPQSFVVDVDGVLPPKAIPIGNASWAASASWSPDGNLLLVDSGIQGKLRSNKNSSELRIADLRTGKTSVVPLSQGLIGVGWISKDSIVAATQDATKLLTFDFTTQKWSDLTAGALTAMAISPDRRYVYYTTGGAAPKAWRLRFADHRIETITSLEDATRAGKMGWLGGIEVAPDGSPLLTRETGTQEVYALNVRWPR
jgi:eukaryotic-like serine/threonine-protein kinase